MPTISAPRIRNTLFGPSNHMGKLSVGLGILSWKGQGSTLCASLESHRDAGLFEMFDRVYVLLQEERQVLPRLGAPHLEAPAEFETIGIMDGMVKIVKKLSTDYVLFLGHDTHTIADSETLREQLQAAILHMQTDTGHCRDRRVQCYLTHHGVLQAMRDGNIHTGNLSREQRELVSRRGRITYENTSGHWFLHTPLAPWSNIGALFPRKWFLDELIPAVKAEKKENQHWTRGFLRQEYASLPQHLTPNTIAAYQHQWTPAMCAAAKRAADEGHQVLSRDYLNMEETLSKGTWWYEQPWLVGMIGTEIFAYHREDDTPIWEDVHSQYICLPRKEWYPSPATPRQTPSTS